LEDWKYMQQMKERGETPVAYNEGMQVACRSTCSCERIKLFDHGTNCVETDYVNRGTQRTEGKEMHTPMKRDFGDQFGPLCREIVNDCRMTFYSSTLGISPLEQGQNKQQDCNKSHSESTGCCRVCLG